MFVRKMITIINQLYFLLLVAVPAAFISIGYRCFRVGWCNPAHRAGPGHQSSAVFIATQGEERDIEGNPPVGLTIPAHKFRKDTGLAQEDGMCAMCLCEYEEGEELRTLLECMHSFHVPCIDTWLYSHSTCPVCHTHALPSPEISKC